MDFCLFLICRGENLFYFTHNMVACTKCYCLYRCGMPGMVALCTKLQTSALAGPILMPHFYFPCSTPIAPFFPPSWPHRWTQNLYKKVVVGLLGSIFLNSQYKFVQLTHSHQFTVGYRITRTFKLYRQPEPDLLAYWIFPLFTTKDYGVNFIKTSIYM